MILRILKKDLKRKRTMNIILLLFIILAAMFIASSANNMLTVSTALDYFFEKAKVPDYWFAVTDEKDLKTFETFAGKNNYRYTNTKFSQIDPKDVKVEGEKFNYSNSLCLSPLYGNKIFDENSDELLSVNDGEVYVTAEVFLTTDNDFHIGSKISISTNGIEKEFIVKGYVKDALLGSSMVGMTRFFLSDHDLNFFFEQNGSLYHSINVYTKDTAYTDKFNHLGLNTVMSVNYEAIKMMYIMDMLMAAILLVVSICLILISMVILHFIINFTISEEFREIGVMKAIGITNGRIRGLYIVKYLAIAAVGTIVGLLLSFPFGQIMLERVSQKILLPNQNHSLINIAAALFAAAAVILFCYLCTRKIRHFSPIDAIRNGETGERYKKKGMIRLSRMKLPVIPFMACNDILSGLRRYISMIVIFILGTLLVIIPVNTINTLRSDNIICSFNMSECDHVIAQELLFSPDQDNEALILDRLNEIRDILYSHQVEADVFQEVFFRSNISLGKKTANSMSFLGIGDITADKYTYLEGSAPQNEHEAALSYVTAEKIGAKIGDTVEITTGGETKTYLVCAVTQSLNNLGEGIRFYEEEKADLSYAVGSFGVQIRYRDNPDKKLLEQRQLLLTEQYPDADIYTAGGYINHMIGNTAGQIESIKTMILIIVLCINMLVAILMVKSFLTKEKSEIALLKAVGFKNSSLCLWQTMRIGIILLISVIIGALLSYPLSSLMITPIFRMMGAYSIDFEIVPAEVYVVFPLIVLSATSFAAFLAAQGLRRISAAETSNIE